MDFYRIRKPGSEWLVRQTDVIKAAKAAGVEWDKLEVPTSKPELQAWLNENVRDDVAAPSSEPAETDTPQPVRSGKEEHCPKCKFTPRQADVYVASRKRMLNVDALKEWISEREGWELSTVIGEITERLGELAKLAVGKKA